MGNKLKPLQSKICSSTARLTHCHNALEYHLASRFRKRGVSLCNDRLRPCRQARKLNVGAQGKQRVGARSDLIVWVMYRLNLDLLKSRGFTGLMEIAFREQPLVVNITENRRRLVAAKPATEVVVTAALRAVRRAPACRALTSARRPANGVSAFRREASPAARLPAGWTNP